MFFWNKYDLKKPGDFIVSEEKHYEKIMKKNPTWKRMRCVFFFQTSNLHPNKQKYKSEKETLYFYYTK
jgi:hypothetical protein